MSSEAFGKLATAFLRGEDVRIVDLPSVVVAVNARTALGDSIAANMVGASATISDLPVGTHVVEALNREGAIVAEEFISVRQHRGDDPVMAFVTSFDRESARSVMAWLEQLRCTVVQVYDWMECYSAPLAKSGQYNDPLGRSIDRSALGELVAAIKQLGAVAQAYAPVCAADHAFADAHPEWRLLRNDGTPENLGTLLEIMNPADAGWQQHWIEAYGAALDGLGFDGLHLDTYGYPRCATDVDGELVEVEEGYAEFLAAVRRARPNEVISFNQVNGVPRGFVAPAIPGFRYVEVWPPNDRWRHLEGLLARSAGRNEFRGDTLAIYPPVWDGSRDASLRTVVLSEAIVTILGANTLVWGDDSGALCHPYYFDHEKLGIDEIATALDWHRFGLRCRDLFKGGGDTSWFELDDENAAVQVSWSGITSPEPIGGALFARVVRTRDLVVVSLLDLTGSVDGSWSSPTGPGSCQEAQVSVLVDSPGEWFAEVSVLGLDNGRHRTLKTELMTHREGQALSCRVPVNEGWSVLRLRRNKEQP